MMSNFMLGKRSDFLLNVHRNKSNENEQVTKKLEPKKSKKIRMSMSLVPAVSNNSTNRFGAVSSSRHVGNSKHSFGQPSQVICNVTRTDKSVDWHTTLAITFETFLLQLDEAISKMRKDTTPGNTSHSLLRINSYKDICERLRSEILISIDELDLLVIPPTSNVEGQMDFSQSMRTLKAELAKIRVQYHQAIKKFAPKIV